MSYLIMYTNVNGYLISTLTYKSGEQMEQLGKYGFLRRDYLKNNRNSTYQVIFLQDKEADQMAWVRVANQHKAIAEEIILKELIYV